MGIRAALVIVASLVLARESNPPADGIHRVGEGAIYVLESPSTRRLRGDWEPPGLLVIAHAEQWANSVAAIIRAAGDETDIAVVMRSGDSITALSGWLAAEKVLSPRVRFLDARLDSPWVRDFGPLEVVGPDGELIWLDALYDTTRPLDDVLPELLGQSRRVRVEPLPYSIDGGAVVSNGRGLCVATSASLDATGVALDTLVDMESLQGQLGCTAFAVVPALVGERTGHIDISVQFLSPNMVAVASIAPSRSVNNGRILDDTARAIREAGRLLGQDVDVVRVHMPVGEDGETFFTYVNGIRLHAGFVVPSYSAVSKVDERAAYADLDVGLREVPLIATPADPMIELSGAIHCIALGLSAGFRREEVSGALR